MTFRDFFFQLFQFFSKMLLDSHLKEGIPMKYNFDEVIDRNNTDSAKWDGINLHYNDKDLLPFWVADMDFQAPQAVIDALVKRAAHGIFGYNIFSDSYKTAVTGWMDKRHGWQIDKDWLVFSPGVVTALSCIIQAYTEPGDKILIQPPVYYPFKSMIEDNGREAVVNPLKLENGRYEMDFEDLKNKIDENVKMLMLCNPHNPGGRVWTKEELIELGEICLANNILVLSDDIHHDLVFKKDTYIPFASISEEFAQASITCTAPSKTFNLAGLQASNIIVSNTELRKKLDQVMGRLGLKSANTFGLVATESAYLEGEEWLNQLLIYLQENIDYTTSFIGEHIPTIRVMQPEATYLIWLDCRELGVDVKELNTFLIKEAKVVFNSGDMYGIGGDGFIRVNIACPKSMLEDGLNRLLKGLQQFSI